MKSEFTMSSRDYATELVEGYINEHGLGAGDRLPSERVLCEMWDLNRTTLHSAIKRLVVLGTLYSRVGSGTYVSAPKMVRDLHDVRGFSEAARAEGFTPGSLVLSTEVVEANKVVTGKLHVPLGSKVFVLRRMRLIDGMPATVETTHVSLDLFPGIDTYDFSQESLFDVMRREYGIAPAEGDEKLSITRLDEEEAALLGYPVGAPAFFQTGVLVNADGVPVEYFKGIVQSERIRFACELSN